MGIFRTIGNFFRAPQPLPMPEVEPAPLSAAELEWQRVKSFVQECERQGLALGRLQPDDPVGFWSRRCAIDESVRGGMPLERAAKDAGYSGAQHWKLVERYFESRYCELAPNVTGELHVRYVPEFQQAALIAQRQRLEASKKKDEERALEPIQGITIERFAELSAAVALIGNAATRAEMSNVLAEFGVGPGTFGAARRAWLARIKEDKTGRLRARFLAALQKARGERAASGVHRADALQSEDAASARRSWVADIDVA